jgi:translocator protein
MLAIGSLLGFLMARRRAEIAYPLVLAWAFAGIFFNQAGFTLVMIAAALAAVAMLAAALSALLMRRREPGFGV